MTKCQQTGCKGTIEDGYCDTCGLSPVSTAAASPAAGGTTTGAITNSPSSIRNPSSIAQAMSPSSGVTVSSSLATAAFGSQRSGSVQTRRLSQTSGRSRLGVGLVNIPTAAELDPTKVVLKNPEVKEEKRYCSSCNKAVGRGRDGMPGRVKGFCPSCGAAFDFAPKLKPGAVLNAQYEVVNAIAHGGMGWIYLARDLNLSGRPVVIKGLVNAADKDLQEAVITEKSFLAEVTHPLIVEVFNFINHEGVNYIVMEYVGGTSLNDLLKDRLKANNGAYSPLPLDQAIAFIVEILPAFSYLHNKGLLYCDFKPANLMQVGDGVKLIDLGGVRRIDDQTSALFGTVGFQGPEVPDRGASVASDIYTIARTLAVLTFEFRGYQSTFVSSLPAAADVPLFAAHDSYYRLLLKATAPAPEDRFQSAEELREQLIGVLREVVGANSVDAPQRSVPSAHFDAPGVEAHPTWSDLPALRMDPTDPLSAWLGGLTVTDPAERVSLLTRAPGGMTTMARVDLANTLLQANTTERNVEANNVANEILQRDPWEWRGIWLHGLAALQRADVPAAVSAFNAVYGQLPGELAPKLALAVACEKNNDLDVAARLYEVCAQTDATYSALGLMGLARIASLKGDSSAAMLALDRIPKTSRLWSRSRQDRAAMLVAHASGATPDVAAGDLDLALLEHKASGVDESTHAEFRAHAYREMLKLAPNGIANRTLGGVPISPEKLRESLEASLREQARTARTREEKITLINEANRVRVRTLF